MADTKKITRMTLNEGIFKQVKLLSKAGLKAKDIAEIVGIAKNTAHRLAQYDTLEDYQTARRAYMVEYHARRSMTNVETVGTQVSNMDETAYVAADEDEQDAPAETPNETLAQLTRVADALERLADAWEAAPAKKGLFK